MRKGIISFGLVLGLVACGSTSFASVVNRLNSVALPTQLMNTHPVSVTAGATGQGPADQNECDKWAKAVNDLNGVAKAKEAQGDKEGAAFYQELAWDYDDNAQERGCFIVY